MNRREFMQGVFGTAVAALVPLPVQAIGNFSNYDWRIRNLYHVVGQDGKSIPFKPNPAQTIIMKSRQMGMTESTVNYAMSTVPASFWIMNTWPE